MGSPASPSRRRSSWGRPAPPPKARQPATSRREGLSHSVTPRVSPGAWSAAWRCQCCRLRSAQLSFPDFVCLCLGHGGLSLCSCLGLFFYRILGWPGWCYLSDFCIPTPHVASLVSMPPWVLFFHCITDSPVALTLSCPPWRSWNILGTRLIILALRRTSINARIHLGPRSPCAHSEIDS